MKIVGVKIGDMVDVKPIAERESCNSGLVVDIRGSTMTLEIIMDIPRRIKFDMVTGKQISDYPYWEVV